MEILTKHKLKWSNCTTAYGKSKYYSFEKNNGDLLYSMYITIVKNI